MTIVNFNVDWNSGIALCALIESLQSGACPQYASLSSANKIENCRLGMDLAEEYFCIPSIISPEDFSNPEVDDLSVMTYLSYFVHYFMRILLQWIRQQVTFKVIDNFDSDWCDGLCLTALCNTIKPGMLPDIDSLDPNENLKNVTNAMIAAEKELGVPITYVQPADMANVAESDDILNCIYLTGFMTARPKIEATATGEALEATVVGCRAQFEQEISYETIKDMKIEIQNGSEMLEPSIEEINSKEYNISHVPVLLGPATITNKAYGHSIAKSLYHVTVVEPQGVILGQLEIEASAVKRPMKVTFTGVNEIALMTMSIQHPDEQIEEIWLSSISREKSQAIFVPPVYGEYGIIIEINGKKVSGCPFKVMIKKLIDFVIFGATTESPIRTTACVITRFKIPSHEACLIEEGLLTIRFDTKDLVCNKIEHGAFDSSSEEMQYTFMDEGSGCYVAEFMFPKSGYYSMSVFLDDDDIAGSPFDIEVMAPVDASKCFFVQNLMSSLVNVGTRIKIQFDCTTAGDGELVATIDGPQKQLHVEASLESSSNRRMYSLVFTPEEVGDHTLNILWGGEPIPSAPISFTAVDPNKVRMNLPPNGKFDLVTGDTITFNIDISLAGAAPLFVYKISENGVKQELPLEDESNSVFLLKYLMTQVGTMQLIVVFNEVEVKAIPVTISAAPDASKCHAYGKAYGKAFETGACFNVGYPIEFNVDCSNAGAGEFSSSGKDPQSDDFSVYSNEEKKAVSLIRSDPKLVHIRTVDVLLSGVHIPRSQIKFDVANPNLVVIKDLPAMPHYVDVVGQEIAFEIDSRQAGSGKVIVQAIIQKTKKENPQLLEIECGLTQVAYTPTSAGTLELVLLFNSVKPLSEKWICDVINSAVFAVILPKQLGKQNDYVKFLVTGIKQDAKHLDVVAIHKEHEAVVTLEQIDSNSMCCFMAKQLGEYNVIVKCGMKNISGSPFTVEVCNPANCKLSKEFPRLFHVGENDTINIDASTAGPGTLTCFLCPLSGGKQPLQYEIIEKECRTYDLLLKPLEVGSCQVIIMWGGYGIPEGVLEVDVVDARAVKVICEALNQDKVEKVDFNIDGREAGKAPVAFKVKGPKMEYLTDPEMVNNQNDTVTGSFTPCHSGVHTVGVLWGERHVRFSPFKLSVRRLVDPTKIVIQGDNQGCVGLPGVLQVLTPHEGLLEEDGLVANMVREVEANLAGQEPKIELTDNCTTVYKLTYLVPVPGDYKLTVTYNKADVSNSPFTLSIQPPADRDKCRVQHYYLDEDHNIENPVDFSVDVTHAGYGSLITKVLDPNNSQVQMYTDVDHTPLNVIHYLKFKPKGIGKYTVNILWDDAAIPGTPFTVNVINPSKCNIKGLPLKDNTAVLNELFSYRVRTKRAGDGKVHSVISRPGQDDTTLEPTKKGEHIHQFQYKPDRMGQFSIRVFFSKKELNGSPFICKTVDTGSVGVVLLAEAALVCEPYEFHIQGSFSDTKAIEAIAHGPKDEIAVKVYPLMKNLRIAHFIPLQAGSYEVFVEYSGQQVPKSPFSIACFDPGKCEMIGVSDLPLILQVGRKVEFQVKTVGAGPGTISLLINNEQENRSCGTVVEAQSDNDIHKITLMPKIIGEISIHVLFAGHGIPRTPFRAQICDASKCRIVADFMKTGHSLTGKVITFTLIAIEAGVAKPIIKAEGPFTQYTVDVMEVSANTYECAFTPWQVGKQTIEIKWGIDHIPGSPFEVSVGQSDEGVCTATGLGLTKAVAGEPAKFDIHTTNPGLVDDGILVVSVKPAHYKAIHYKADVQIEDKHNGLYMVTYIAPSPGSYLANIKYNDEHIIGSPFKIRTIAGADATRCHAYGPALESKSNRYTDVAQEFYVDAANAGCGKLTVYVRGPNNKECKVYVKEDRNIFTVKFNAEDEGRYTITVFWSKKQIPGSPFRIKVKQAANAGMVKAYGPGLRNGRLGDCEEFTIETKNAGTGTLTIHVHGVRGSFKVEAFAKDPDEPHVLTARYSPTIAGEFVIFIRWAGTQIPGSPFKVIITDPSGFDPSVPVSNVPYSIEPSYKPSQDKKARKKSSKSEIDYHDDEEQLLTELPEDDEDEEERIPTPDSNAKGNTNITDPSGFDPAVPVSNVPYSIERSYKPSQDKKARKKSTKSDIDDEEQLLTELPKDDEDEVVCIPTPDSNAKNTNITDPSGFDPSVPISNVPYSIEPSYKPSQDKKARKKSTKSEIDYHDDEEQLLIELPEDDEDEEVRISTPDSDAKDNTDFLSYMLLAKW